MMVRAQPFAVLTRRLWIPAVFLTLAMGRGATADIVTTTDNQTFPNVHIDSVIATPNGGAVFYLRGIKDNKVVGKPYPLPSDKISRIEFRTPWDTNSSPEGRPAALVLRDGRRFEGVWVESFTHKGNDLSFRVRQATVPAGGETHDVPISYLDHIEMTPMYLPGADLGGVVPGLTNRQSLAPAGPGGQPAAPAPGQPTPPGPEAPATQTPPSGPPPEGVPPGTTQPTPQPTATPAQTPAPTGNGQPPATGSAAPGAPPPSGSANSATPPATPAPQGTPAASVQVTPTPGGDKTVAAAFADESKPSGKSAAGASASSGKDWNFELDKGTSSSGGGGSWGGSSLGFSLFGYFIGLGSILIGMLIAFIAGGISLYFSARTEGTSDLKMPKAIGTAALLTIIPPVAFYLVLRTLVYFLPFLFLVWLVVAITVWYFTARAIIMGMLEVLESKATSILCWFYIYLILGQYLAKKALEYFG